MWICADVRAVKEGGQFQFTTAASGAREREVRRELGRGGCRLNFRDRRANWSVGSWSVVLSSFACLSKQSWREVNMADRAKTAGLAKYNSSETMLLYLVSN
jgi:hypothetical protein